MRLTRGRAISYLAPLSKTVVFSVEMPMPLLTCAHCRRRFILYAVFWHVEHDKSKSYDEFIDQISTYFCPYCGRKWQQMEEKQCIEGDDL